MAYTAAAGDLNAEIIRAINNLVGPRATRVYEFMLNSSSDSVCGDDEFTGNTTIRDTLLEHGMAQPLPGSPGKLRATEPVLAFEAAILHQQRRTMEQQTRITAAQRLAYDLRRRLDRESDVGAPRLVSRPEEVIALSNSIARIATEEFLTTNSRRALRRTQAHRLSRTAPALRDRKVKHRSIY